MGRGCRVARFAAHTEAKGVGGAEGASRGAAEAFELRDGDPGRFEGRGVLTAVANLNGEIADAVRGLDALDQDAIDARMRALDGAPQLSLDF